MMTLQRKVNICIKKAVDIKVKAGKCVWCGAPVFTWICSWPSFKNLWAGCLFPLWAQGFLSKATMLSFILWCMRAVTSHTQADTHTHCANTPRRMMNTHTLALPLYTNALSITHPARSIIKVYCCFAIEGSIFSSLFFSAPPTPFSFPYFPTSPLVLSSSSPADESADQLSPLKWPGPAPSHWFSSRERGAEVLGEKGRRWEELCGGRRRGRDRKRWVRF